jgi:hypothetical protein
MRRRGEPVRALRSARVRRRDRERHPARYREELSLRARLARPAAHRRAFPRHVRDASRENNPRGWFQNAKDVDTTTPKVSRNGASASCGPPTKHQGPSGHRRAGHDHLGSRGRGVSPGAYYGDPRLAGRSRRKPSCADRRDGALDEYFQKIRDAGFRVGVTVRPQRITFKDGIPAHGYVDDPQRSCSTRSNTPVPLAVHPVLCRLHVRQEGALTADVFRAIHRKHPDILLLPRTRRCATTRTALP